MVERLESFGKFSVKFRLRGKTFPKLEASKIDIPQEDKTSEVKFEFIIRKINRRLKIKSVELCTSLTVVFKIISDFLQRTKNL
jgi:hypothetical protein